MELISVLERRANDRRAKFWQHNKNTDFSKQLTKKKQKCRFDLLKLESRLLIEKEPSVKRTIQRKINDIKIYLKDVSQQKTL